MEAKYEDIRDWTLEAAAKHLSMTVSELLRCGAEDELTLSIRKPDELSVWLSTVVPNQSKNQYKSEAMHTPDAHLFSEQVDAFLLNISPKDCEHLEKTTIRKCVFDSVYIAERYAFIPQVQVLDFKEGDQEQWPSRLLKKFLSSDELKRFKFSDDSEFTIKLEDTEKADAEFLESLDAGLMLLRSPNLARQFGLFKEGKRPIKRADLVHIEEIDVTVDSLYVANWELKAFINQSKFMGLEKGDWTSVLLSHLIDAATQAYPDSLVKCGPDSENLKVREKYKAILINLGAIRSDKDNFFRYFCHLASSDDCFYDPAIVKKVKDFLLNDEKGCEVPCHTPTVLFALDWLARAENSDGAGPDKYYLTHRLGELGFTSVLAKHAARIILKSSRAAVK